MTSQDHQPGAARPATGTGVSVVVPVYRSGPTLGTLVERIRQVLAEHPHEVILVDDGSPSTTWSIVRSLATESDNVAAIRLGRNFGQHNALVAGVRAARYPLIVTLDDDLQNPPEEIPKLIRALGSDLDVVYGSAAEASQDRWRRTAGKLTRWAMSSALGAENATRMTSFRAFRTDLRRAFPTEIGPAVSLDALLAWGTTRFGSVEVEHHPRAEGRSNYTLRHLFRFAIDTATGYSALPLQVATTIGLATSFFGALLLGWVLIRLAITGESVPGFPFLASAITIFAGAQLLTLGIIGEYLARMHFRVMGKPTYFVAEMVPEVSGDPVQTDHYEHRTSSNSSSVAEHRSEERHAG